MKAGDRHTATIIEPNDGAPALRVDARMIRARHPITLAAAHHNDKRLERTGMQMLSDIGNHVRNLPEASLCRKRATSRFSAVTSA
jgi:hypothetical protein